MSQGQKEQTNRSVQASREWETGKPKRKSLFIIIGVIVLIVLAFIVGSIIRNGDTKIVGEQPLPITEEKQKKEAKVQQTPEEVINDYLTAIRNKDYEKAATYISEDAKKINSKLNENPTEWIYREFKSEPLVRFRIKPEAENLSENRRLYKADIFVDNGWPQPKEEHGKFFLELENGIWKVNPTSEAYSEYLSNKQ